MEKAHPWYNTDLTREERIDALVNELTLEEKCGMLRHESRAVERLDVPEYNWWNECLHGVARNGKATVFPQIIGLGASFDRQLVRDMANAISDEARAKYHAAVASGNRGKFAGLTFWTPNINIFRDPRWGRGQETYGEDPYHTAEMSLEFVRGLQGDRDDYLKSAACAKHFAVHSGPEKDRHSFDAQVSMRDLHETYLPAFKALVEKGKVEAVMGAYNRVNGEPACAQSYLMDQLRNKWGFEGHFVSDCWALQDFHQHHKVTKGPVASVKLALESGCDLNCGSTYEQFLLKAVESGALEERYVDISLKRLLRTRMKLGMFDPDETVAWSKISTEVVDSETHRALALESARKSIVMLKNQNGVLPLGKHMRRIFVTGHNAVSVHALMGNYFGISTKMTTVLEGIADRAPEGMTIEYKYGCLMERESPNPKQWAVGDAKSHDVTIAVVGISELLEGEEGDALLSSTVGDRERVELPSNQVKFLETLIETGKPIVVVVLAGSAIAMPEIVEKATAIIYAWYPGEEGGNAVADVIFGNYNPAGRLPVTFPRKTEDLPSFEEYSMVGRTYRFDQKNPLFRFGYGLSYTNFEYGELKIENANINAEENLLVSVTVKNVGERKGDEVIQLYLQPESPSVPAPSIQLAAFERVSFAAGEEKELSFEIDSSRFEFFSDNGEPFIESGKWILSVGGAQPSDPAFKGHQSQIRIVS